MEAHHFCETLFHRFFVLPKCHFIKSLFSRTITSSNFIWPNLHISESPNKRKLIILNIIFSNRRLAERFFWKTSFSRTSFPRKDFEPSVISPESFSHFTFVLRSNMKKLLLLWNVQLLISSRPQTRTGIDFNTTVCFWTQYHFQWMLIFMKLFFFKYSSKIS